jgi:hypothetical protein
MELIDAARDFGQAVYDGITFPGNVVLAKLGAVLPAADPAARGIGPGDFDPLPLILSLLAWLLLALAGLRILRWAQGVARRFGEALAGAGLRFRLARARFRGALARLFRSREDASGLATGRVEFDDTDIAVLRIASSQPAGYAVSLPDLVAHFRVRPSVVQKSLERLSGHRLLEPVLGHTDGFENYRLTSTGAAFARSMD